MYSKCLVSRHFLRRRNFYGRWDTNTKAHISLYIVSNNNKSNYRFCLIKEN